ncbi:MAG: hypothetical protein D6775_09280 [Caldilineae bacterium]|nr:MAG: hypothetical protein D6775_09280 [Caldilineae bacterium]
MPRPFKRWTQLLTIWLERPAQDKRPAEWRFSLEDPHTGQRRGFGSLDGLVAFLREQLADRGGEDAGRAPRGRK